VAVWLKPVLGEVEAVATALRLAASVVTSAEAVAAVATDWLVCASELFDGLPLLAKLASLRAVAALVLVDVLVVATSAPAMSEA
jgi:hypothetical protein